MSAPVPKKAASDTTKLGEHAAMQPLSGRHTVEQSIAVSGLGHGAFVRSKDEADHKKKPVH